MMNRVAEVNKELVRLGSPYRLKRGAGYYYFYGADAMSWPASSVYTFRANSLTVAEWLRELDQLKANAPAKPTPADPYRLRLTLRQEKE